jgi:hypothetical protein
MKPFPAASSPLGSIPSLVVREPACYRAPADPDVVARA